MPSPYSFAADTSLPPAIAARMQQVANSRASRGLISADGQTHPNAECRDIYDQGHGCLSRAYRAAMPR
jgi:hypothetical protein